MQNPTSDGSLPGSTAHINSLSHHTSTASTTPHSMAQPSSLHGGPGLSPSTESTDASTNLIDLHSPAPIPEQRMQGLMENLNINN